MLVAWSVLVPDNIRDVAYHANMTLAGHKVYMTRVNHDDGGFDSYEPIHIHVDRIFAMRDGTGNFIVIEGEGLESPHDLVMTYAQDSKFAITSTSAHFCGPYRDGHQVTTLTIV